jgi:hypothetical protein
MVATPRGRAGGKSFAAAYYIGFGDVETSRAAPDTHSKE